MFDAKAVLDSLNTRAMKVFSPEQARQFIQDGYVVIRGAIDPQTCQQVRQMVWDRIKLSQDKPEEWPATRHFHLRESLRGPAIDQAISSQVQAAFDDLMGASAWRNPGQLGWWPVLFPAKTPTTWQEPQTGWHVDGIQFHHHLTSPDQGLLPIFIFSDCDPDDGGTVFEVGSHRRVAQILADAEPEGLNATELCKRVNSQPRGRVERVVGQAGDVALLHPFINHTTGVNVGAKRVRFICNQCVQLVQPMRLDRPSPAEHSLVELATLWALNGRVGASV